LWIAGFYVAFMPLYVLGLMGMTRRLQHNSVPEWQPWLIVAAFGVVLIALGIGAQIAQLVVSVRRRHALRDTTGDPWNGRTLEWSTASPPPAFNFAVIPIVEGRDAWWEDKRRGRASRAAVRYQDILLPRNSPTGFVCAFFATLLGFGLIWHIWWLALAALAGAYATFVVFAWRDRSVERIGPDSVEATDRAGSAARSAAPMLAGGVA
jgi:cytochrome o ubiquinol oxidase subunit I